MRRPRLGVRARLLLAVVAAVVLALAIGVTAFTLLLSHRLSASATSLARAQAQAAVSSLDVRGGRLSAHEAPDQGASPGQVWVFADKRQVEAPNASRVVAAAARALAGGPERTETVEEQTRLYALPVVDNGRRFGTVVTAVALDPYEDTERTAFVGALILAALLLAAVAVLSRWMLGRALEPVSRMTAAAAAWRASDLDRRFALGEPYDELTRLAATLDDRCRAPREVWHGPAVHGQAERQRETGALRRRDRRGGVHHWLAERVRLPGHRLRLFLDDLVEHFPKGVVGRSHC